MFSIFKKPTALQQLTYPNVYCLPLERVKTQNFLFFGGVYSAQLRLIEACAPVMSGQSTLTPYHRETVSARLATQANEIPGEAVYGGILHNHFGHFICDTLSRLWVVSEISENVPLVFMVTEGGVPQFARDFFELAGLEHRIKIITQATRIKSLMIPQQSVFYPGKFQPQYLKLSQYFLSRNTFESNTSSQVMAVSREKLPPGYSRYVVGETAISHALAAQGAKVIHPETLALAEQFSLFNEHKVIVGYAGSSMHNLLYTHGNKQLFYYSSRKIPALYKKIDKALNNHAKYITAPRAPGNGMLNLKVGFKPEIIDVPAVLDALQHFLSAHHGKHGMQPPAAHSSQARSTNHQNNIAVEYNTAVMLRYIVEQAALGSEKLTSEYLALSKDYEFDRELIQAATKTSPVLRHFFSKLEAGSLTDAEAEHFNQLRDKTPAEPKSFRQT